MGDRPRAHSLRWKASAFVLVVSGSFVAATYFLQRTIVQPEFASLEAREADANLGRAVEALARDAEFLAKSARDYAAWDDTYAFVETRSREYIDANLLPETLSNLGVDALVITSRGGEPIWGRRCCSADGAMIDDPELIAALVAHGGGLVDHDSPKARRFGVLFAGPGLVLVGSAAITDTEQKAPVRGSLILARLIDEEEAASLGERTRVALSLTPIRTAGGEDQLAIAKLAAGATTWHDTSAPDRLRSYRIVRDVTGEPAILVRAELPREISRRAAAAARLAALTSLAGGLAMLFVMSWVTERFLVRPLERVTAHAVRVGAKGDLHSRLKLEERDEIGVLAREFDRMVERLEHAQAQVVEVAHKAGRAEVATALLHDIGNVLNSVTVSACVAVDTLGRSELPSLRLATDLLRRNEADLVSFLSSDPHGKHLPSFLSELTTQLESEQQLLQSELKSLGASIEHIRALVRHQNDHSEAARLRELVDPRALLEQARALRADSPGRLVTNVELRGQPVAPMLLDRHRCLQVLANLLGNAEHAVRGRGDGARIWMTFGLVDAPDGRWLEIGVRDNGVGILPQNLERIFARGFSTRPDGHGIGLHSSANLAREMGGSLAAASDGAGRGALFTLRIPAVFGEAP